MNKFVLYLQSFRTKKDVDMTILDWFCLYVFSYVLIVIGLVGCFVGLVLLIIITPIETIIFVEIVSLLLLVFGTAYYRYNSFSLL